MNLLAIVLLVVSSDEGTAVTGNPLIPFTDEEQIKLVITTLEEGLLYKEQELVTSCFSEKVSTQKVLVDFDRYVTNVQAPTDKPLVCLQSVEVDINGKQATARLDAFSYGNGIRIYAVHKIPFIKIDEEWAIAEPGAVSVILKQIGGITPQAEVDVPLGNTAPATTSESVRTYTTPASIVETENTTPDIREDEENEIDISSRKVEQ